jgi:hypothetical protein
MDTLLFAEASANAPHSSLEPAPNLDTVVEIA